MERATGEMAAKCMDFEIFCLPLPREGEGEITGNKQKSDKEDAKESIGRDGGDGSGDFGSDGCDPLAGVGSCPHLWDRGSRKPPGSRYGDSTGESSANQDDRDRRRQAGGVPLRERRGHEAGGVG